MAKEAAGTSSRKRLGTVATSRMKVKDAVVLPVPATDEKPKEESPLTESAGTVAMPTGNAKNEEPCPTLLPFTDKELIDEIQRRGWSGEVLLKVKNVTIKIEL